ncbi:flavin reductase family protein [Alicyclobacillus acidiphilus]|uniref:flavin reductase family protein n=1 Tax=Alicyclobacillus acidiphilus TaxID=182455 RepID=UPI00083195FE|nr:flavin reductase family protein [Alicyclobacillus acidiphilus]
MTIDAAHFRRALGRFASGVTVVTMAFGEEVSGITVSAFASLSLNPPLVLVCIDKSSSTLGLIRRGKSFAVNILASDQRDLSNHFASKQPDKMAGIPHRVGQLGNPILHGTQANLECVLREEFDGGDHFILIGEVHAVEVDEAKTPLLYYSSQYGSFEALT